jgi:hypothetical protein
MKKIIGTLAAGLAVLLALATVGVANAQTGTGTVTVIHGVPGLTVDVYVNGDLTLEDFAPETITDPLELPAGDYDIEIYAADADPETDQAAITGSTTLPADANASIIAHLSEDGTPMLSVFVNDLSDVEAGNARVTVRHTAAAPAVDVWADGAVLFENLANPDEASGDVPADTYSVAVSATGATDPVLGPTDLSLDAGTAYFVYAVGSLEDDSLDLLIQTASVMEAAESHANDLPVAGFGPSNESYNYAWLIGGLVAAGVLLSLAGTGLAVRRNR